LWLSAMRTRNDAEERKNVYSFMGYSGLRQVSRT
jgi:hypothetical protein